MAVANPVSLFFLCLPYLFMFNQAFAVGDITGIRDKTWVDSAVEAGDLGLSTPLPRRVANPGADGLHHILRFRIQKMISFIHLVI